MKISWHRYGRHDYITSRGKDNFVKKKRTTVIIWTESWTSIPEVIL